MKRKPIFCKGCVHITNRKHRKFANLIQLEFMEGTGRADETRYRSDCLECQILAAEQARLQHQEPAQCQPRNDTGFTVGPRPSNSAGIPPPYSEPKSGQDHYRANGSTLPLRGYGFSS